MLWDVIINFVTGLFKTWFGEKSRDAAHYNHGQAEAENKGLEDSAKRAEKADENEDNAAVADDDTLDEWMRSNRPKQD